MKEFKFLSLMLLLTMLVFVSCEKSNSFEEISTDLAPPADLGPLDDLAILDAEEEKYASEMLGEAAVERAACDDCNPMPHDAYTLSHFIIERDYGSVDNDLSATSNNACWPGVFNTCGGWMVITGPDDDGERVELKLGSNKNTYLNDQSYLKFRGLLEDFPSSGEFTIAQVHNRHPDSERPFLRVIVKNGKLGWKIADRYYGSSNQVNYDDDDMWTINEGDRFVVQMTILGSGNRIKLWAKNYTTGSSKTKTWDLDNISGDNKWLDVDGSFYFKTGIYLQDDMDPVRFSYNYFKFGD